MNSLSKFLKEVRQEMSRVVWPAREQAVRLTFITVVVAAVIGICITVLDYCFSNLIEVLIG